MVHDFQLSSESCDDEDDEDNNNNNNDTYVKPYCGVGHNLFKMYLLLGESTRNLDFKSLFKIKRRVLSNGRLAWAGGLS